MISHSDTEYIETKHVKLGNIQIPEHLREVSDKFEERFNIKPLNIYFDHLKHSNNRPRLQIIFEKYSEQKQFMGNGLFPNSVKQNEVIQMLAGIERFSKIDSIDKTLILFKSFEPIAKQEANNLIPQQEIDELLTKIDNPELWLIRRSFSTATFFFYTKKQVETARQTILNELTDKYFELIKHYDEFNLLERTEFAVDLDDKETFDTVYQSNWFYYAKDH